MPFLLLPDNPLHRDLRDSLFYWHRSCHFHQESAEAVLRRCVYFGLDANLVDTLFLFSWFWFFCRGRFGCLVCCFLPNALIEHRLEPRQAINCWTFHGARCRCSPLDRTLSIYPAYRARARCGHYPTTTLLTITLPRQPFGCRKLSLKPLRICV